MTTKLKLKLETLCAKRVSSRRGKFFFAFLYVSEYFESIETHLFFSKIFMSAKRKTCKSVKPEEVKRPRMRVECEARGSEATEIASAQRLSSPAGLA